MLLEPHSMQLQQLAGMVYQPMSGRWELQEDPSVNYIAYFRKLQCKVSMSHVSLGAVSHAMMRTTPGNALQQVEIEC